MMRPVIMTDAARTAMKQTMDYAKSHPLTKAALQAITSTGKTHLHPEECYFHVPLNIEIGVTYELQGDDGQQPFWHVSFKLTDQSDGRTLINPDAAEMILNHMGLTLTNNAGFADIDGVLNAWFEDKKP